MGKKNQSDSRSAQNGSFEFHLEQLEQIVQRLEHGQLDLSQSLQLFETGLSHLKDCHQRLSEAEARIALVAKVDPDGNATLQDLELEAESQATQKDRPGKRGNKGS